MRKDKYINEEITSSALSGEYTVGPYSEASSFLMAYALTLRNVYLYKVKEGRRIVSWGFKKSYLDPQTGQLRVCGLRGCSSSSSGYYIWTSDFAEFYPKDDAKELALYYQYSLLNIDNNSLDEDQRSFQSLFSAEWSPLMTAGQKEKRLRGGLIGKAANLLYSKDFENTIAYLATTQSIGMDNLTVPRKIGLVRIPCSMDGEGRIIRANEGELHTYAPEAKLKLKLTFELIDDLGGKPDFIPQFWNYAAVFQNKPNSEASLRSYVCSDKLHTCDPVFYESVKGAIRKIRKHFEDFEDEKASDSKPLKRPLNCLILGAPGSGKTFLAREIKMALMGSGEYDCYFDEFNLSHVSKPGDIDEIFRKIRDDFVRVELPRVYFFDEFDATISGTSIIRYLIDYIYEGAMHSRSFGRVAFLFSGGTLENAATLRLLQSHAFDMDFSSFLADYWENSNCLGTRTEITELLTIASQHEYIRKNSERGRNPVNYLLALHKLRDFLSRINGTIIQIPDISDPLSITLSRPALLIDQDYGDAGLELMSRFGLSRGIGPIGKNRSPDLIDFILALERTFPKVFQLNEEERRYPFLYTNSSVVMHILEYKNMKLCERLRLITIHFNKNHESTLSYLFGDREMLPSQVKIDKEHLHFLSTVPLRHGVRSLIFIISQMKMHDSLFRQLDLGDIQAMSAPALKKLTLTFRLPREAFNDTTFKMHVAESRYSDLRRWWKSIFKGEDSMYVSPSLKFHDSDLFKSGFYTFGKVPIEKMF